MDLYRTPRHVNLLLVSPGADSFFSHRMYSFIMFRKSTPLQSQLPYKVNSPTKSSLLLASLELSDT